VVEGLAFARTFALEVGVCLTHKLRQERAMQCEVCGNDYDKPLMIDYQGDEHVFDCFECAISELAPSCDNCGIQIIGHGNEAGGDMYCGAHCAAQRGHGEMRDRA
jgi:hypothetical protein